MNKHSIEIAQLSQNNKHLSKLYDDNLDYLTDLNYLYNIAPIEDKHGFLKSIFPGCLTASKEGYRTPTINKIVSANSLSLGSLLHIESERGLPFSEKSPVRVRNGDRTQYFNLFNQFTSRFPVFLKVKLRYNVGISNVKRITHQFHY